MNYLTRQTINVINYLFDMTMFNVRDILLTVPNICGEKHYFAITIKFNYLLTYTYKNCF